MFAGVGEKVGKLGFLSHGENTTYGAGGGQLAGVRHVLVRFGSRLGGNFYLCVGGQRDAGSEGQCETDERYWPQAVADGVAKQEEPDGRRNDGFHREAQGRGCGGGEFVEGESVDDNG